MRRGNVGREYFYYVGRLEMIGEKLVGENVIEVGVEDGLFNFSFELVCCVVFCVFYFYFF